MHFLQTYVLFSWPAIAPGLHSGEYAARNQPCHSKTMLSSSFVPLICVGVNGEKCLQKGSHGTSANGVGREGSGSKEVSISWLMEAVWCDVLS